MELRRLAIALVAMLALAGPALAQSHPACQTVVSTSITASAISNPFVPRRHHGYIRVTVSALGASQTVQVRPQILFPTGSVWADLDAPTAIAANGTTIYAVGDSGLITSTLVADAFPAFAGEQARFNVVLFNTANATLVIDWCPQDPG